MQNTMRTLLLILLMLLAPLAGCTSEDATNDDGTTDDNSGGTGADGNGTGTDSGNGTDDGNGTNEPASLSRTSWQSGSTDCNVGTAHVESGLDDGDGGATAGDGVLDDGEVDITESSCYHLSHNAHFGGPYVREDPAWEDWNGAYSESLGSIDSQLIFNGYDPTGTLGNELWGYDATTGEITLLADINSGEGTSWPYAFNVIDGMLYFYARDNSHGLELWRHDPTSGSTEFVIDFNTGTHEDWNGQIVQNDSSPYAIAKHGTNLFVIADDGVHGDEWHVVDLEAGTSRLLTDMSTDSEYYGGAYSANEKHIVVGTTIFFGGHDDTYGEGLFALNMETETITHVSSSILSIDGCSTWSQSDGTLCYVEGNQAVVSASHDGWHTTMIVHLDAASLTATVLQSELYDHELWGVQVDESFYMCDYAYDWDENYNRVNESMVIHKFTAELGFEEAVVQGRELPTHVFTVTEHFAIIQNSTGIWVVDDLENLNGWQFEEGMYADLTMGIHMLDGAENSWFFVDYGIPNSWDPYLIELVLSVS